VVVFGLVLGFAIPAVLFTLSVLESGKVPVNMTAFTAFVFPLSIAYAVHKRDLFQVDALVQRGFYYAILSGLVTAAYVGFAALATHVLHLSPLGQSASFSLVLTLVVLLAMPRLRDRAQRLVDLIFGRRSYDAQEVLASASTALGATLDLDEIVRLILTIPGTTLGLGRTALFLRSAGGFAEAAAEPPRAVTPAGPRLEADGPLALLLGTRAQPVVREILAGEHAACRADFDALGGDLVVALACQGRLTGFLVCGRRQNGAAFTAGDVSFLRTFANQAALSLQNARTFRDLELLNVDLERRVDERTEQLEESLEQLGTAYRTLQASQEQLLAAEKMAAFGRLAAGIAHEMNTPLGAALNGLKVAHDVALDCERLVEDPAAPADERRGAFADLRKMIGSVEEWTRKAVAYIRSVKAHGRNAGGSAAPFDLARLLESDLQPLLMHRLRLVGGVLDVRLPADLPELFGDAGRLGQVLANLINNAIDACEGLPPERTRILIEAMHEGGDVVLRIADRGTGIPAEDRERIFEPFYTTKPPGKGTGLGLAIARDIVTGEFGGTLACTHSGPEGTAFTMRLPVAAPPAANTGTRTARPSLGAAA
jgi:signal transduction histidine kinase